MTRIDAVSGAIATSGPPRLTPITRRDVVRWIENDPSLIHDDRTIIGRAVLTPFGPIDLLAVDPFGRWYVIIVRCGPIRRSTTDRTLRLAASIRAMPTAELRSIAEAYLATRPGPGPRTLDDLPHAGSAFPPFSCPTREVEAIVVGTGRHPRFERLVEDLARGSYPVSVVQFGPAEPWKLAPERERRGWRYACYCVENGISEEAAWDVPES